MGAGTYAPTHKREVRCRVLRGGRGLAAIALYFGIGVSSIVCGAPVFAAALPALKEPAARIFRCDWDEWFGLKGFSRCGFEAITAIKDVHFEVSETGGQTFGFVGDEPPDSAKYATQFIEELFPKWREGGAWIVRHMTLAPHTRHYFRFITVGGVHIIVKEDEPADRDAPFAAVILTTDEAVLKRERDDNELYTNKAQEADPTPE